MRRIGRIALKTILWIIGSVLFLVLLVIILIQIPSVQNYLKNKAVAFIEGKIHTKVAIGHISLGLPKLIVLQGVYFEDQKKDTLIAGDNLKVDVSMLKLLHHQVEVNEINLDGITMNVNRGPDSVFNFDYIIKAFAGEQRKPVTPADTSSSMKFSVDKIILDKINIAYKDAITGNDIKFLLGHFDTRIKDFDMDKMKFTIPKINLSGVDAHIIQKSPKGKATPVTAPDTATKPINMTLDLGTIDISKIKVNYQSNQMSSLVDLGKLLVVMDKIDLKNQNVGIKTIELNDTKAGITFAKPESVKKAVVKAVKKLDTLVASPKSDKGWRATIAKISFANDDIKYDNNATAPVAKGLDFGHMHIRGLEVDMENLAYNPDSISGRINTLTFAEKSGLRVNKFHTSFLYGPKSSYLNDLYLETPQTVLQKQLQVSYPSIESLSTDPGKLYVNADLNGSRLGLKDVLLLMPAMSSMEPFKHSPDAVFRIDGRVIGKVNNLRIPELEVRGLSKTHIKASAVIRGLPDINKSYFDLTINDLSTGSSDITKLVSPGMLPSSVSVPSALNLKGTFKGSMYNFNTRMMLRSSYGAVGLDATMKNGNKKGHEVYSANIKTNNLNVGALTKQPKTAGNITLALNIKGAGTDPKTANLQVSGNVASAYVKGYTYQNLVLTATGHDGKYTANMHMNDPNIHFALNGRANMNKKYPSVYSIIVVDSVDLQKLHLSNDALKIHGKLIADVPTADPGYLNANIKLTDLVVAQKQQVIRLDSINLVSTANADSSTLRLKTPMLTAHMAGKYKLTEIGPAMQDVIDKYYNTSTAGKTMQGRGAYSPQHFTFSIRAVKTPLVTQFAPDLKTLEPVNVDGRFDSRSGELVVNGTMPKVVYGTTIVDNMKLAINTGNNALNYNLAVNEIKLSSSIDLLYTRVSGNAQNNKLNVMLQVRDAAKKERYRVAGVFSIMPDQYKFSFVKDGLVLNYTPWAVNAGNELDFGTKGILAKDFAISNSNQVLSVNSDSRVMNSPMTISFKNFRIETLTRAAQQDSLQVGGVINGDAHIRDLQTNMHFTSALNIHDFSFKGDTVGDIALKVNNQTQNAYAADVRITGKGNQVNLSGLYYATPASTFDLNLDIARLNMKSIEGFTFGSIKNAKGNLSGQLKISGTTSAPVVRGDVNFNQVGFNVAMLNSYFTMPKESITFNNDGIIFNDFTMIDSLGNKAVVAGGVYTKTFTDFRFGLDITTDNFRVINSTQDDNKLYYGKLFLNSRITVRGNMDKPVVDANLTINDKTDMTIVLPTDDPSIEDRKGVVEVINPKAPKLDSIFLAKQLDSLRKSNVRGLDVSATIRVSKEANFTIVVDERNGDVVQLKGDAQLNAAIDPSGKINLTGTYAVDQGSYNLSYASVKRKFLFKKGSTITWSGDPTTATVDLTAIYVANVPPIDLVSDQLGGDVQNMTMYKQKLPFNVNLIMRNQLLKPDITFDIILPDSSYTVSPQVVSTVDTRLDQVRQDPNELNKQVLGVLILGHFIGDNPLQSQGGSTGIAGTIRNSVSSLLSDQLNRLAGDLIGGVQLSFNLTSGADYSTGVQQNRTDLDVGLSKSFLNDRVTVTVGNNFNLEGQNQPGQKTTDIAGNVSVNYLLTKDGRYRIRAYRKDEFIVIEGQVVETGVGFSLTYDFNRFSELFKRRPKRDRELQKEYNKDQKEKKKEQKEADKQADADMAGIVEPTDEP
ncbi:translocation/assembly module TamB domain-containing protein [Mucilaginibacter ginsenosidivorans]|uniref:Translocation/assembly module TamB n=1 Tax=Mucilaginibacter ginsenosidivorans TaxID=398053 RepID=A0A5B8UT32_9SPHI|nr:translocation/assembly module TamB domain-containing protein [Mucilaginibacter ginsenosidivorans]QEC62048.1 translocation/assembly module TamB [Mucilaginibacter ginsenosidivorans]